MKFKNRSDNIDAFKLSNHDYPSWFFDDNSNIMIISTKPLTIKLCDTSEVLNKYSTEWIVNDNGHIYTMSVDDFHEMYEQIELVKNNRII